MADSLLGWLIGPTGLRRANSPLRFRYMDGYSDYYPELPGGIANGRSIEPDMFDGKLLGAELANLNPAYLATPTGLTVFSADYKWLNLALVNLKGTAVATAPCQVPPNWRSASRAIWRLPSGAVIVATQLPSRGTSGSAWAQAVVANSAPASMTRGLSRMREV